MIAGTTQYKFSIIFNFASVKALTGEFLWPYGAFDAVAVGRKPGILLTMRKSLVSVMTAAILALLAASGAYTAEAADSPLIPGSDPAEVKQCGGVGTAYIYREYIIYISKSPSFEGQYIYVFKPRAAVPNPCSLAGRDAF